MQILNNISVFGDPLQNAVDQMDNCLRKGAHAAALMADHHLGYAVPVGGVIAYRDHISPSGVGFDIGCGNKAVLTNATLSDVKGDISRIMDEVVAKVSFGIGRVNKTKVDHALFDAEQWTDIEMLRPLKDMARGQLGTVGSGNHYVDIFADEAERIWIGVHFGSRGLGHKIASHYIKAGGGTDGILVDPVLLDVHTDLGREYIAAMQLAGDYAYAGRDWVCAEVARILCADIIDEVHNHHNYAWREQHAGVDLWVVRKGATPAWPGQRGFVGGTMGENSVILQGAQSDLSAAALYSTVHGAGRAMSRTEAAGKCKWKGGQKVRVSEGKVSQHMMDEWLADANVELRGGGCDESPHAYKRLTDVLTAQGDTVQILHQLKPLGVAMAGADVYDPYKD
jgi:tRNA-splicing ligase RtcB